MGAQRVDKWLYLARFFKTRSLAAAVVESGHLRVNGVKVGKPAQIVGTGDVLTFVQAGRVRVVRVLAAGTRRGPAPEAQALYADIEENRPAGTTPAEPGGGDPTTA